MTDYADTLLRLNRLTKSFLEAVIRNRKSEYYLIACSIMEAAQELEEWASKHSVH
jgi:hypothetical protein